MVVVIERLEFHARHHAGEIAGCQAPGLRKGRKFLEVLACAGAACRYDGPLLKMSERETILLDALLEDVIEPHAFRAVLKNGHRFTAYIAVRDRKKRAPENGSRVKVELSPCNMSAGRIII
jgi:translation initiation factor IF-1